MVISPIARMMQKEKYDQLTSRGMTTLAMTANELSKLPFTMISCAPCAVCLPASSAYSARI
jgi:hypothetical protein